MRLAPSVVDLRTGAFAALTAARDQIALVPRAEPSDVDGPLGIAGSHLLDAVDLLGQLGAPMTGALADARAAQSLLATWDDMGWGEGHAASATVVLTAADRLIESARTRMTSVGG